MFTWKELDDGRSIILATNGAQPTRAWYVKGATVDAALADPNPARPFRGQAHPDYPGLVVETAAYRKYLLGVRVEARYVAEEYLGEPPEPGTDENYIDINPYFEPHSRELPVIETYVQAFRDSDTPDQTLWRFSNRTVPYIYDRLAFSIEVNAELPSTASVSVMLNEMRNLRSQVGKIHTIDGNKYVFSVEDAGRINKDRYKFVYKWVDDPGVPNTLNIVQQPNDRNGANWGYTATGGSSAYGFADMDHIIPPFSRIDTQWDTTDGVPDPSISPLFRVVPEGLEDPQGWMTLPGIFP
jgi:hypothetical protein